MRNNMAKKLSLRYVFRHYSPTLRARSAALKKFADKLGLVYFGSVDQHDDDYSPIRGFTASITHKDSHYLVGTYNDYDVRIVDRFDVIPLAGKSHEQLWTIFEVSLTNKNSPHVVFVPTGHEGGEYSRLFTTQTHLQPINTMALQNHSREIHGRFQIMAKTSDVPHVEQLLPSPTVVGIAARFWPHGIELRDGKLYLYLTQHRLEKAALETAIASLVWLAEVFDESLDT